MCQSCLQMSHKHEAVLYWEEHFLEVADGVLIYNISINTYVLVIFLLLVQIICIVNIYIHVYIIYILQKDSLNTFFCFLRFLYYGGKEIIQFSMN